MITAQASRLVTAPAYAVLPAEDLDRARRFYTEVLGFETQEFPEMRQFVIQSGKGTQIMVYERARTTAQHTAATFIVDSLREVMEDLVSRGVVFEEYDMPGLKTTAGVAEMDEGSAAWFTDTEGNIINIAETR